MRNLNITERRSGSAIVLDLEGNIRLGEGSLELRNALSQLIKGGEKKVLLNLAHVTYIDSSGLGEIVAGYTSLQKNGGEMKLMYLTRRVNELMIITKLLTVFEVFDNETEAVNSFQSLSENTEIKQSTVVTEKLAQAAVNL